MRDDDVDWPVLLLAISLVLLGALGLGVIVAGLT